jgi:hypothetical protein
MDAGLEIDPVSRRDPFYRAVGIPGINIGVKPKLDGPIQENHQNEHPPKTQDSFWIHLHCSLPCILCKNARRINPEAICKAISPFNPAIDRITFVLV